MKKIILSLTLLLYFKVTLGQIVISSCVAPDSIFSAYKKDADRLAIRRITQTASTYQDSVEIPKIVSDTFLNALIAVYNATTLPARNAVVSYDIHTFFNPSINNIDVAADSNLTWMHQLRNNSIPTGYIPIDSLMSKYHLHVINYADFSGLLAYHVVYFQSDSNYNTSALANRFDSIGGVSYAEVSNYVGDGNDIQASVYPTYVQLIYSYGWGDCLSGCTYRHYWQFKVYYDCSVEFISDYGAPLNTTDIRPYETSTFSFAPNPSNTVIHLVENSEQLVEIKIYDILGNQLLKTTQQEIDVSSLANGVYFIQAGNSAQKVIVQH